MFDFAWNSVVPNYMVIFVNAPQSERSSDGSIQMPLLDAFHSGGRPVDVTHAKRWSNYRLSSLAKIYEMAGDDPIIIYVLCIYI